MGSIIDYSHLMIGLVTISMGIVGTVFGIYVSQQRTNATQDEKNGNIEKRLLKLEKDSDGHRDKINELLLKMNEKIGKIYTMLESIKKQ